MDIQTKQEKLKQIYDDFEIRARPFKSGAVCEVGCAFCCTHFGNVDAITLEALIKIFYFIIPNTQRHGGAKERRAKLQGRGRSFLNIL